MTRETILQEISEERDRQVTKGYTSAHDDQHNTREFVALVKDYMAAPGPENGAGFYSRTRLVQAAALLVAAVESIDREDEKG